MSTLATEPIETPRLMTVPEAAAFLRVSRATTYRLVAAGELPALRVGHSLRFDVAELQQWLYGSSPQREDH